MVVIPIEIVNLADRLTKPAIASNQVDIINWKKGERGRCPQAGGFTPSTPKTIFNLIAPSY
ncbi:MAG: hypothetical protein K6T90_22285, partial [Leptolyngbyaceae cyanobacterium HOT.MB2.61]|nr:hypothetical protein [Leptolyngbyaceae cyanobacterium HOT.MB2.61]